MSRGKKDRAGQIVNLLRQVEVRVSNGETLPQACKEAEIVEQTLPLEQRVRRSSGRPISGFIIHFSPSRQ